MSKARICEILALDPSPFLDDLLRQELVYADPARELNFWRPTPSALLALGLRSFSDIPALKELEDWFDSLATQSSAGASPTGSELDSYFARTRNLHSRRLKSDSERRQSVASRTERIPTGEESDPDLSRRKPATTPLPHPGDSPESIVQAGPPQGAATRSGEKEL